MNDVKEGFKSWAIVEVMGHNVYAGLATETSIGGTSFLRVDVPGIGEEPPFTKLLGTGSIFAISPCDEATARAFAATKRIRPFDAWTVNYTRAALPAPSTETQTGPESGDEQEYDDDDY